MNAGNRPDDERVESFRDFRRGQRRGHLECQAFARVVVDDGQDPDPVPLGPAAPGLRPIDVDKPKS